MKYSDISALITPVMKLQKHSIEYLFIEYSNNRFYLFI